MLALSIILLLSIGLNIYFAFLLFLKNEEEDDEYEPDDWLREEDEAAWEKIEMERAARWAGQNNRNK